jgi:hypothetical protein
MEKLAQVNLKGVLKEEIEKIKDAVMIMDYDGAIEVMEKLKSVI